MKRFPSFFLAAVVLALAGAPGAVAASVPAPVELNWLGGTPPAAATGVSWGVPWPRGAVQKDETFALAAKNGKALPLQSWTLAYWPDGSIKWTGFATVAGPGTPGPFTLTPGPAEDAAQAVKVTESDTTYDINTGPLQCRIRKWGGGLFESLSVDGREVARDGRLVCIDQEGPNLDPAVAPPRERYWGTVEKVTIEQSGPVRAVVKIEGKHRGATNGRAWLPFVVRLYFYAGQTAVRMVHTVIYDGDQHKDFIRGLGVTCQVPLREETQNRHVMFSGAEGGLWAEPVQPMVGRGGRFVADPQTGDDLYPAQLAGQRVPNRAQVSARGQYFLADWAVWDGFKLVQPNADGFTIVKRTNAQSCWLPAGAGKRATGFAFVGDVSGGLGISVKDFWQSYPASLEVEGASGGAATLTAWLWSPDAPAMDLRHYDTKPHGLESVYEDVQEGFSTPYGVARTSELTLYPTADVPAKADAVRLAQAGAQTPLLVCTPQYLHSVPVFGVWSLPDRSTPVKRAIEDHLDTVLAYYEKQVDERNWYGFWDYGDVRHSYDAVRHVWRYDLGGMAWDNTELAAPMWLWCSFLRTGRADLFRMAEALTRNTSEVDVYHLGPMAGLGSRHNVRHWGDGSKEARISQSAYDRFYYYLTTDERTGDNMRAEDNVDAKMVEFDPMREAQPRTPDEAKYPARVRLGPDWLAFVGNWMTAWERTGDVKWRDKILAGVDSLAQMPLGLRSGENLVYGYDPATGKLYQLSGAAGDYNLATIMGGAEVVFELNQLLDDARWQKLWLQYCRLYYAPRDVLVQDMTTGTEGADARYARPDRLAAYVYFKTGNTAFAKRAVDGLLAGMQRQKLANERITGPDSLNPVDEIARLATNDAAQDSLVAIEDLQMCADQFPEKMPVFPERPRGWERGYRRAAPAATGVPPAHP